MATTFLHSLDPIRSLASARLTVIEGAMQAKKWKQDDAPLYRGDHKDAVTVPTPGADPSVIRHVMYFEGPGRETPYLSTSERREVAERFAQTGGIWGISVPEAKALGLRHIDRLELLEIMRGDGKGLAKWPDPFEVMQARRYVEEHSEHLIDFSGIENAEVLVKTVFRKS